MSAVLEARKPIARHLDPLQPPVVQYFGLLATATGGVARVRELILGLAVQGKVVRQDCLDEPASALLQRIGLEWARFAEAGKSKRSRDLALDIEFEPPFSLPKGWAWSTLSSIGIINPRNDAPGDIVASFVQMSSVPVAFTDAHVAEPRPWRDIKSGFTQFAEGDVGVAKITPCFENGKSTVFQNLSNGIGAGTTELHIVRPLCGISPRYVLLFLKSPSFLREGEAKMTGTAGQKRLPRTYFENTPFPLPPLAEQARIVARVDELMRLCDALEAKGRLEAEQHARLLGALLGTLTESTSPEELAANWQRVAEHFDLMLDRPEAVDALEQTILKLAVRGLLVQQDPSDVPDSGSQSPNIASTGCPAVKVGARAGAALQAIADDEATFSLPPAWEWTRLGALVDMLNGYAFKSEWFKSSGTRLLRNVNIGHGRADWSQPVFIDDISAGEFSQFNLRAGDVVLTLDRPIISTGLKFAVLHEDDLPCLLLQRVARLAPRPEAMSREFLVLWLQSDLFTGVIDPGRSNGVPHISTKQVGSMVVGLPPLAEQARIVARVDQLRHLCAALRHRIAASENIQSRLADVLVEQAAA